MRAGLATLLAAIFALGLVRADAASAQSVSLTTLGSAYTQNFDTLSNVAGSTTNNLTINGWEMTEGGGGARDNEQYAVDAGASTTGDTYSYGAPGSTERALGELRAGTLIPLFGASFTNNTGSTITSLDVAYTGEQWRLGTAGRTDQLNFEYSTNATDLVTGTWTNAAALNFVTPDTTTVGAKNGNAAAERTSRSTSITGLSIPNGATFWIRWNDQDASGADDGLAVDDFSLTPQGATPLPNLTVNDVTLNEGNAGTTSFTFTVSLSAPAIPGGVTFDIATADGTAQDHNPASEDSDYNPKSLLAQTIPAGSSTYSFTVLVNGDTTIEPNETFFVNVTNVSGANVADGQGQGTIQNDDLATAADLAITKTDGVTTATPGGSVTYTITASNAGPSSISGANVSDTFPATLTATWTCVGAGGGTCTASGSGNINDSVNLPAGASVTYTASAAISASASGSLSNTATVTAPSGATDPTPGNNSATDTDTLTPQSDLAITKTDGRTTATPGGSTTYTITASNAGPSNAPGATVADTFPASLTATWTCVGAGGGTCTASGSGNINDTVNLPSGGSVTYTVSATISASATGSLSNTATVTAPGGVTDPTPGNNSATDTDTLSPQADLSITKTDGVTSVTPGGSTTYTITASNAGPSNAPGAKVADTFPASLTATWTCVGAGGGTCTASGSGNINDTVNLPVGGSVTYTATATISASATGSLSNTASVAAPAGVTDPTPGNNSATDTDTVSPQADLSIAKTDGVTSVKAGSSTTYTITASNAGPSNAPGATVADTFPASLTATWTCVGAGGGNCTPSGSGNINDAVNLPVGGSVTYTVSATIASSASGSLSNTATVSAPAGITDPSPGNNSDTDTDTVTPPDVAPSITSAADTTFEAGQAGSFTVTATGRPTPSLSKSGALPPGVGFKDNGDGTATLSGTPAAGSGGTYKLTITAGNGVSPDATQSFTLTVDQPPAITSASGATFATGEQGSFTVTTSGFPAPKLSEAGALPDGTSFKDNGDGTATLSGTPAAGSGGTYKLTITAANGVAPDATQSFTLTISAPPSVSISSPSDGARYKRGQRVRAGYSCEDGAGGPGLSDCTGTVADGQPIDTATAGGHSFSVTAVSKDGQRTTKTVHYSVVLPDNHFTVKHVRASSSGRVRFQLTVPGAGGVGMLETAPRSNAARASGLLQPNPARLVFARKQLSLSSATTRTVTVNPNQRGRLLVAHHPRGMSIRLTVGYTPTGGTQRKVTLAVRIPGRRQPQPPAFTGQVRQ